MLTKCAHSIYLASVQERLTKCARYCSLCTPSVDADFMRRKKIRSAAEKGGA